MHVSRLTPLLAIALVGCFGSHHDGDDGLCRTFDAQGVGACRAVLGWSFDGANCVSIGGCECVGADCGALFSSQDECLAACFEEPDPPGPVPGAGECDAQDITGEGLCRAIAGFSWDGEACGAVVCRCSGSDCDEMFATQEECEGAYGECLLAPPVEPSCEPEVEGPVPVAPACRPGAERWYFTEAGCQEGCACTEGTGAYGWPDACPPSYESAIACVEAHADCPTACGAMDARGEGGCRGYFGAAWNGSECVGIGGCECIGEDCDALYPDHVTCEAAHASCVEPNPTPNACVGDVDGPFEGCDTGPEVWWLTDRGCEPGCECTDTPAGRCVRSFRTVEECLWTAEACGGDCGPGEISEHLCRGLPRWVWTGSVCALTSACEGELHDTEEECLRANAICE